MLVNGLIFHSSFLISQRISPKGKGKDRWELIKFDVSPFVNVLLNLGKNLCHAIGKEMEAPQTFEFIKANEIC